MTKLTVLKSSDLLAALQADASKTLVIEKKRNDSKGKAEFLNVKFNVGPHVRKDGWIRADNIQLTRGVADPNDEDDKRNAYKEGDKQSSLRMQIQTTLSNAGDFGQALHLLNEEYRRQVKKLIDDGEIEQGRREIHDLFQYTYKADKKLKKEAGVIEDPILRIGFDFKTYHLAHPISQVRGKPITEFFDYRTEYVENGIKKYKPAQVEVDGEMVPVSVENIHLFVTAGSIVKKGRFSISAVSVSQGWISMPVKASELVILPGEDGGFDDEDAADDAENVAETTAEVAAEVAAEAIGVAVKIEPADIDEINELIDNALDI